MIPGPSSEAYKFRVKRSVNRFSMTKTHLEQTELIGHNFDINMSAWDKSIPAYNTVKWGTQLRVEFCDLASNSGIHSWSDLGCERMEGFASTVICISNIIPFGWHWWAILRFNDYVLSNLAGGLYHYCAQHTPIQTDKKCHHINSWC